MKPELINLILLQMEKFHQAGKKIFFSPMGLGEPFLFSSWEALFKKIKQIGSIPIVIATNGILLTPQTNKKLIESGIDEIIISLNCNNKQDYKKNIGIDAYNKVVENTKNLINLRNQNGKKIPRIYIQYLDYSGEPEIFQESIKNWNKLMKYDDKCFIHSVANQAGFYQGKTSIQNNQTYPCTQPLWRIAIKINGDIYPCDPCFYSGNQKIPSLYIGNIKNTDLFEYFFSKNSKKLAIINNMKKMNYSQLPECEKCNTYKLASNPFFKFGNKWI